MGSILPFPGVPTKTPSPVAIAASYWPGRWTRAAIVAGFALEPMIDPRSPCEWAGILDALERVVLPLEPKEPRYP